jgi:hypothetical protein
MEDELRKPRSQLPSLAWPSEHLHRSVLLLASWEKMDSGWLGPAFFVREGARPLRKIMSVSLQENPSRMPGRVRLFHCRLDADHLLDRRVDLAFVVGSPFQAPIDVD